MPRSSCPGRRRGANAAASAPAAAAAAAQAAFLGSAAATSTPAAASTATAPVRVVAVSGFASAGFDFFSSLTDRLSASSESAAVSPAAHRRSALSTADARADDFSLRVLDAFGPSSSSLLNPATLADATASGSTALAGAGNDVAAAFDFGAAPASGAAPVAAATLHRCCGDRQTGRSPAIVIAAGFQLDKVISCSSGIQCSFRRARVLRSRSQNVHVGGNAIQHVAHSRTTARLRSKERRR